jgi:hypothetical protein
MHFLATIFCSIFSTVSIAMASDASNQGVYVQCGFITSADPPHDKFGLRNTNETDCHRIEHGTTAFAVENYTIYAGCFCQFFQ